jgi:hypothetical protein
LKEKRKKIVLSNQPKLLKEALVVGLRVRSRFAKVESFQGTECAWLSKDKVLLFAKKAKSKKQKAKK